MGDMHRRRFRQAGAAEVLAKQGRGTLRAGAEAGFVDDELIVPAWFVSLRVCMERVAGSLKQNCDDAMTFSSGFKAGPEPILEIGQL